MVNKKRLIRLTQRLIRIDSQNPPGDESKIALFVRDRLKALGFKTKIIEFKKRRSNVVASLEGRDKQHSLLITPHLDTVPCGRSWRHGPFSALIQKNRIYGLGATDCKGNLACALEVMHSIAEGKTALDYNLIFCASADEESGSSLGLEPLLERKILRPHAALVLDADNFEIIVKQKGLIHLKIKIRGRRAHGAYPWRGVNAIDIATDIIRQMREFKFPCVKDKYLRPPTINIGTIKGGDKVNVVADWCEFELDFRFLPGTRAEDLLKEIRRIAEKQAKRFYRSSILPHDTLKIEIEGIQDPYSIGQAHPLVDSLKKAMRSFKIKPVVKGSEGATVITFFQKKNIPAVASGFGSNGCAHAADEYVEIDNLYRGALVLEEFLKNYRFS